MVASTVARVLDLAIRGGIVVTEAGERHTDIGVAGEKIAAIGEVGPAAREIDATGKLVLPGCVDLHTHLEPPHLDDMAAGSRAAAAGGVTTVLTFATQREGEGLVPAALRAVEASREAVVDHAFHVIVIDPSDRAIADLPELAATGHSGIKIFMVIRQFADRTADFLRLLRAAGEAGVLCAIHAEDHDLITRRTRELLEEGNAGVDYFPESRPPEAEEIAVRAAIRHAETAAAPVYLMHLSSRVAIEALREAKRRGAPVFGETRPIYLYLTRDVFRRPDGAIFVGQPPLRDREDIDALWKALADGTLDTVGTDHYPHRRADKLDPARTFTTIPPGMANLQTLLPMLHSEGVLKGRLSLRRMVEVLATAPARIAGLAPRKGAIAIGADADIVVFDPRLRRTVRSEDLVSNADHDPFEGWDVTGWPVTVLLRGRPIYEGRVIGRPGQGQFTPRSPFPLGTPARAHG